MWKKVRDNMLLIALAVGICLGVMQGRGWLTYVGPSWLVPLLLFGMLLFAFCKVNPLEMRLLPWHGALLAFQLVVSLTLFVLIRPASEMMAQGIMLCVLMPTATAAPIVAAKLGGKLEQITAFVLLSNVVTAVWVPLIFPLINPAVQIPYLARMTEILTHIAPLLFGPFVVAWAIRLIYDARMRRLHRPERFRLPEKLTQVPFYLWVCMVVILIKRTTASLFGYDGPMLALVGLFAGALFACLLQFFVGKWMGAKLNKNLPERVARATVGQALGQKNSALAIWMAHAWLSPLAALAPAAYILWQNLFNGWQLFRASSQQTPRG